MNLNWVRNTSLVKLEKDKIRNEDIKNNLRLAPTETKMRARLLKWFDHV